MDSCPRDEQLRGLLEERLTPAEGPDVVTHVQGCDRCQALLEEWTCYRLDGASLQASAAESGARLSAGGPGQAGLAPDLSFLAPPRGNGELGWLAHYRVLRLLGEGGMGLVFQAEDSDLRRTVALKVLRPELAHDDLARRRFLREARAAAAMRSEHIVTVYQVGADTDVPFLAMELLEGESLQGRLVREGKMSIAEVLRIGRETAEALAAAHAQDLVHRDIKPANLWLEAPTGRVKVLDFGLALPVQEDLDLTQTGCVVGTPNYMAPEQARHQAVDARCDLFSLGSVLYHLLTGSRPFHGDTTMALLTALAIDRPPPPRQVNPACPVPLDRLVLKLLAKKPDDRPASAQEVIQALETIERSLAGRSAPHPTRRRWWVLAGSLAAVAGLASLVLLWLGPIRQVAGPALTNNAEARHSGGVQAPVERDKPFALLRRNGETSAEFRTLSEAVSALQGGDAVEVHGNGPFRLGRLEFLDRDLTLRAGPGYQPVFISDADLQDGYWITVAQGAVQITGCNFRITSPNLGWLKGGGARWVVENCQVVSAASPDLWGPGVIAYTSGPELRCTDCFFLQWRTGVGILRELAPGARIELTNNLMVCLAGNVLFDLAADGGQALHLKNNTLVAFPYVTRQHGCSLLADRRFAEPVSVEATGNLFAFPGGTWDGLPLFRVLCNDRLRWHGRSNFYAGLTADPLLLKTADRGLAAWQKLAEQEVDPRGAEHVAFTWQLLRLPSASATLDALQDVLGRLHPRPPAECGPDLGLVGPGEAYVQALTAAGRRPGQLRPQPEPGGAFVLLRKGEVIGGYSSLPAAALAALDGDTIEVRTDGPFPSAAITGKSRSLTVRAAAGYRPVLEDGLAWKDDTLRLEGLELHRRGLRMSGTSGRVVCLENCAIDGSVELGVGPNKSQATQVLNCLLASPLRGQLAASERLHLRNSVLPRIGLGPATASEPLHVELERCLCWNASSAPVIGVEKGLLAVTVRHTLIASVGGLVSDPKALAAWNGRANFYLLGPRNWYCSTEHPPVTGLPEWRRAWHSDPDSAAADPPFDDAARWRLLPTSPGARPAPGGKDYGADVERIGHRG